MKHVKFISFVLVGILVFSILPLNVVFAEDTNETTTVPSTTAPPTTAPPTTIPSTTEPTTVVEEDEKEPWEIIVAQGKCGKNLEWRFRGDNRLEIRGTGEMYDYEKNKAPWLKYAKSIEYIFIDDEVTALCRYAFLNCSRITEMYIPDNVTVIKEGTFSGCSSLELIGYSQNITSIGKNAFYGCKKLSSIYIKNPYGEIFDSENTIYKSAVIYGFDNSPAYEYAKKYNREFVSIGKYAELPEKADMLNVNEYVSVKASEKSPKWYKFRACGPAAWITRVPYNTGNPWAVAEIFVFDESGFEVLCDGFGDVYMGIGGFYNLTRGEYYYIKVVSDGKIGINPPYYWMPEWTSENQKFDSEENVLFLNVEKTFKDDKNTRWNVYSKKSEGKVDFGDEYGYQIFGTMARLASPVNIYGEVISFESNFETLGYASFKYDPNNATECEMIGASTTQLTMKDELLAGEKEYRLDNVYYLIEEKGQFTFTEERYIYVPVGYYIDGSHVVKHAKKDHVDENYDGMCDMCGVVYREITEIRITNTDTVRSDNKADNIFVLNGTDVAQLLETANVTVSVVDKNGKAVKSDKKLVTGMQLILKDKNGKIVDTKTVIVPGDVDCDGDIKSSDARLALRAAVKLETLDNCQSVAADVADMSKKLTITAADARYILRASVGLESIGDWLKAFK